MPGTSVVMALAGESGLIKMVIGFACDSPAKPIGVVLVGNIHPI